MLSHMGRCVHSWSERTHSTLFLFGSKLGCLISTKMLRTRHCSRNHNKLVISRRPQSCSITQRIESRRQYDLERVRVLICRAVTSCTKYYSRAHSVHRRGVWRAIRRMKKDQPPGGSGTSKSQVSGLCGEVDEKAKAFARLIEGDWPYL